MQKKIIALAIAAAFSAPAMADVTMYGIVDAAVARVSAAGQKSDILAVSGGLSGSRIGAKTAEDLDNGMKAVVVLEYSLDTEQASASNAAGAGTSGVGAARQQMLAVAGGFGTVATGYLQTTGYDWQVKFDPTAGSTVSPLQNVTKGGGFYTGSAAGAARLGRALAYISPDMGGVTVAVNYTTAVAAGLGNLTMNDQTQAGKKTTAYMVSANYTGVDKLVVGGVFTSVNPSSDYTSGVRETSLGASYDLGVAKLFATYQMQGIGGATASNKTQSASAVVPVGPGAVAVSYARISKGSTVNVADGAKGFTVAYLQGLSKMTTAYAAFSRMNQDRGTSAYSVFTNGVAASAAPGWTNGGGNSTQIAVGLKKAF